MTKKNDLNIKHTPVLLYELVSSFQIKNNMCICDATLGLGGHAVKILSMANKLTFVGIDRDEMALERARETLENHTKKNKLFFVHENFSEISSVFRRLNLSKPDFIYFDLGTSLMQLKDSSRGFSFLNDGPLDMRMDKNLTLTAAEIVNSYQEEKLVNIFSKYGEEHASKSIAREIVKARNEKKIKSTLDLANIVKRVKSRNYSGKKIHPATKVFQALRIEVNGELENLKKALKDSIDLIKPGGKLAVISFHSLEDRIVKEEFKLASSDCICPHDFPVCRCEHKKNIKIITKTPIVPTQFEIKQNPSSRSSKLRIVEKL